MGKIEKGLGGSFGTTKLKQMFLGGSKSAGRNTHLHSHQIWSHRPNSAFSRKRLVNFLVFSQLSPANVSFPG